MINPILQGLYHEAWISRHPSLHALLLMEFTDVLQNSIFFLTCLSHTESWAAALRTLTGEPFDKEDPCWVEELMGLQSEKAKH